jgi:hypothetical protein
MNPTLFAMINMNEDELLDAEIWRFQDMYTPLADMSDEHLAEAIEQIESSSVDWRREWLPVLLVERDRRQEINDLGDAGETADTGTTWEAMFTEAAEKLKQFSEQKLKQFSEQERVSAVARQALGELILFRAVPTGVGVKVEMLAGELVITVFGEGLTKVHEDMITKAILNRINQALHPPVFEDLSRVFAKAEQTRDSIREKPYRNIPSIKRYDKGRFRK